MSKKTINTKNKWLDWAIKLQALSQAGLYYTDNEFERERYREIRDIACEILAEHSSVEIDEIHKYFTCDTGYKTPKMDSRAVCFKEDKLLLAQESDGKWSIPGGWIDIDQTLSQNLVKEAWEEAGAKVKPNFIIALHDWKTHASKKYTKLPFQICKVFVYCDIGSMDFHPNSETLQAEFFSKDNLPELSIGKNNYEQIDLCFKAHKAKKNGLMWEPVFD